MSYKTYTTEALVCGSNNSNTSDRSYLLFTKDAGMLWASARSVREERSKQRYALQDFSRIRASLVKGKSGWRVGSVVAEGNPFLQAENRIERACVNFVVAQLRRYVHGEIPLPKVYDDTLELLKQSELTPERSVRLQQLFSIRLLTELGYVAPHEGWIQIIEAPTVSEAFLLYTEDMLSTIVSAIKGAAEASHL